jgi:hypothetical protein
MQVGVDVILPVRAQCHGVLSRRPVNTAKCGRYQPEAIALLEGTPHEPDLLGKSVFKANRLRRYNVNCFVRFYCFVLV